MMMMNYSYARRMCHRYEIRPTGENCMVYVQYNENFSGIYKKLSPFRSPFGGVLLEALSGHV